MTTEPRALLLCEIGTVTTRLTLVDAADGETRLIGQTEVPSSPNGQITAVVLGGALQLGERTGRQLVRGGALLMPQNEQRDGVGGVVMLTSAAGTLRCAIAAVASDVSAQSAARAAAATYTSVVHSVALDAAAHGAVPGERPWIERQMDLLVGLRPDVYLLVGGVEGGAQEALVRLAHLIGLTSLGAKVGGEGETVQEVLRQTVIFAGNSAAQQRVAAALGDRADLRVVDNIRPELDREVLAPAQAAVRQIYHEQLLDAMPGIDEIRRLGGATPAVACEAAGLMTRFVAERYERNVLAVDIGAQTTSAHLAQTGAYMPIVLSGVGVGSGIGGVLAGASVAALARWLPFPIREAELTNRLLNKQIRPQLVPMSDEDAAIEQAVAREALRQVSARLVGLDGPPRYDLVIASGSVLTHAAHPGVAALTLLDALPTIAEDQVFAIELHLDTFGLLAACGALAASHPDAALTLFERDLLRNTPLATCVIPIGDGRLGETAVDVELTISGGAVERISVAHGQIGRIPLAPGQRAQLTLRPAAGVRIGRNAPGAEVSSNVATIGGSELGVIIDARGRHLAQAADLGARQELLWSWLVALGARSGAMPYASALPDLAAEGGAVSDPTLVSDPAAPSASPGARREMESDLMRLRRTVEEPKKSGFFRRR